MASGTQELLHLAWGREEYSVRIHIFSPPKQLQSVSKAFGSARYGADSKFVPAVFQTGAMNFNFRIEIIFNSKDLGLLSL